MDWILWSVPSPKLQLLSPKFLRSSNCSPSLWSVVVWFQRNSVLWHSLQVLKPISSLPYLCIKNSKKDSKKTFHQNYTFRLIFHICIAAKRTYYVTHVCLSVCLSVYPSVHLSSRIHLDAPLGRISVSMILETSMKSVKKTQMRLKWDKGTG